MGGGRVGVQPNLFQLGSGGAVSPSAGFGAKPRRQTHFGQNLLQINLKSGIFLVAVHSPNSDQINDAHWLVRRKIVSAVRHSVVVQNLLISGCSTSRMIDS